jgi:hypothetical protein
MKLLNVIVLISFILTTTDTCASISTTDFNQGHDGWNNGNGLWSVKTDENGIDSNNPYLFMDPNAVGKKRGLIAWNNSEKWTGNYAEKGVTNIRFDARNASTSNPLYFRVAIGDSLNPMSGTWFVSDSLSLLNYNDGWTSIHFDINANSMVKASSAMMSGSPGPGSFNDVFTNVVAIRIISQSSAFSAVAQDHYGDVYIDSVALIPEPHTVGFITISSLILAMRRNSHKKKHPHLRSQLPSRLPQIEDEFTTQHPDF